MTDNISNQRNQADERKKLKKNMSLALDSIINRTTDDNITVNSYDTITTEDTLLDGISFTEEEEPKNDMTSPLDNILNQGTSKVVNIQNESFESLKDRSNVLKSIGIEHDKPTQPVINNGNVQRLNPNDTLLSTTNVPITVVDIIPSFTHIPTYVVQFINNRYLFKWYNKSNCNDLKSFRESLEELYKNTKIPSYVLKPSIFTKPNSSGCFGCIYMNSTHNYFTLRDVINGYTIEYEYDHSPKRMKVKFKNISAIVNSAINIVKIFQDLHSKGNYFYSFYEEDLLINIETGDVLLDISNAITRENEDFNLNKGCIYLAPELLNGTSLPNELSDNHTLSVLLFRILFHNHPLEGKAVIDDLSLDFKNQIKYYSDKAVFIYNNKDDSNRPVRGVHFAVLSMWEKYPRYIREAFIYNFGEKLFSPEERFSPYHWLDILLHLKSDILPCVCGRVDFSFLYELTPEAFYKCQNCGSKYHSLYFKKKKYRIPIYDGNSVYATFLKENPKPFDDVIGIVQENKIHKNVFGLKNVSKIPWNCTVSNGEFRLLQPNSTLPIFQHYSLDYFGSMAEFDYTES
ncbi:MAG: hypothetical protein ACI4WH_00835 [Oscillospiraceae bacterium]